MAARIIHCPDAVLIRPIGDHAWLARLPNGHELTAVFPKGLRDGLPTLSAGRTVALSLSPADFSQGRVTAIR